MDIPADHTFILIVIAAAVIMTVLWFVEWEEGKDRSKANKAKQQEKENVK